MKSRKYYAFPVAATLFGTAWQTQAAVSPYASDANTVFLFHLDETTGSAATNSASGSAASIRSGLTVDGNPLTAGAAVNVTNLWGGGAFAGFGTAANLSAADDLGIPIDTNSNGTFVAPGGTNADTVALGSIMGTDSSFTVEALVNIPNLTTTNRSIFQTDNNDANGTRGFQFRIVNGNIELNSIGTFSNNGTTGTLFAIPTDVANPNAFVANQWFHVALTYTNAGGVEKSTVYWTRVNTTSTQAALLGETTNEGVDPAWVSPLVIGNEGRNTGSGVNMREGLRGLIDEVRISNVARTAGQFVFFNPDIDADSLRDLWEDQYFGNNDKVPTTEELAIANGDGDADGDGFNNRDEQTAGSNPTNNQSTPNDQDADGLADAWEMTNFGSLSQLATGDPDHDFASNDLEETSLTGPNDALQWPDTEGGSGDGLNDGWELHYFGNLSQTASANADGDTGTNLDEMTAGSDPTNSNWTPTRSVLAHRWSFNGNLNDSVGVSNAAIVDPDANAAVGGVATSSATGVTLAGGAWASSDYISLGTNLLKGKMTPVTIELWATQQSVQQWSRIFDFGNGIDDYAFMSWSQAVNANQDVVEWKDATATALVTRNVAGSNAPYILGTKYHIVITLTPAVNTGGLLNEGARVSWYSAPAGTSNPLWSQRGTFDAPHSLVTMNDVNNWLGRSQFNTDATANVTYDEARIWDGALTESERELLHVSGPDVVSYADSDGDGLFDAWETAYFGGLSQGATGNPDADAANNLAEQTNYSNPTIAASVPGDVDGDGLADLFETQYFNNLLQNGAGDFDNDRNTNEVEETAGTNPASNSEWPDLDNDGLNDGWEVFYFGNIAAQNGQGDPDNDTFSNSDEQFYSTNPTVRFSSPDTDADSLADGWELFHFAGARNPVADQQDILDDQNAAGDPDGDGSTNLAEFRALTNPTDNASSPDVNGDGIADGVNFVIQDPLGTASFNSGAGWENLLAPAAGKNYFVGLPNLRTPGVDGNYTFAGDKLVLATVGANIGSLLLKATGTVTIPYLGLDGALVNQAAGATPVVVDGAINVTKTSELWGNNGPMTINSVISGTGQLNITGTRVVMFTGANTWTGNLNVTGAFVLGNGTSGSMTFKPGVSGVNNAITGTGSATLNGVFNINTSTASTTPGASWALVSSTTKTYGAAFSVSGYTADAAAAGARKWKSGSYQFDEATGVLSVLSSGFGSWIDGFSLAAEDKDPNDDADKDGINNLMEYAIDGMSPAVANAAPGSIIGKTVSFTKRTLAVNNNDVIYAIQKSTDLGVSDPWAAVIPTENSATTISYTFPVDAPAKGFVRLRVTK